MPISAIILSGGLARRMHGKSKGLVKLYNKPLIQHIIERIKPQVDEVLINANKDAEGYEGFGLTILPDIRQDNPGPLAGFEVGLNHISKRNGEHLLTIPCDSPLLPEFLASRMLEGLLHADADIAIAKTDDDTHQVFCLMKKCVLPALENYLNSGGRKVKAWQQSLKYVEVDFSDCPEAFANLNTLEDLAALESTSNNEKAAS